MKALIVGALARLCTWLDWLPGWDRDEDGWHWYRSACWGCRLGLANYSLRLDDHWQTGVWT